MNGELSWVFHLDTSLSEKHVAERGGILGVAIHSHGLSYPAQNVASSQKFQKNYKKV